MEFQQKTKRGRDFLFTGGRIFRNGRIEGGDIAVSDGRIVETPTASFNPETIALDGALLLPGLVDLHVHFREPGFEYKETIASGSAAAAAGGFTQVFTMPNLAPAPDTLPNLQIQLDAIRRDARIGVTPYGSITIGRKGAVLSDMEAMAPYVGGFSDDGSGVQDDAVARDAMAAAAAIGKPIVAHCEVDSLLVKGGCIHDGEWAAANGFTGISSASEWKMVERDLELLRDTKCQYHVCHVSTKESVDLIRAAKADGLRVSCETGPHYLVMTDADLRDEGRFKMNPPLRAVRDRDALLEGLADGTVDCVATDHAPHSAEEKSRGLAGSAFGIVGLETSFPVLYSRLVESGMLPLETLVERMAVAPRRLFGLAKCDFSNGSSADFTAIAIGKSLKVDSSKFLSMGKSTPFDGWDVSAETVLTMYRGEIVHRPHIPNDR